MKVKKIKIGIDPDLSRSGLAWRIDKGSIKFKSLEIFALIEYIDYLVKKF